jgi:flagellar biosynthesis/type III secretory pathway chaperone
MTEITHQVDELLDTMDVLMSLFDEEVQVLKSNDLSSLSGLVDRKTSLSHLFEGQLSWLADVRERLNDLDPERKRALDESAERFKQGLLANVAAIDAQRRASERVIEFIIDGVKRATEDGGPYGRSSQVSGATGPLSVALNATF